MQPGRRVSQVVGVALGALLFEVIRRQFRADTWDYGLPDTALEPVTTNGGDPSAQPTTSAIAAPSLERAEAMARYNEALIAPLVAELAETRGRMLAQADRIADLARENGTLAERMAGLERVRDAAMAHAAELEDRRADRQALRSELEQTRTALGELRAAELSRRRDNRRLALTVAVLVALLILMLAAPAWAR